MSSLPSESSPLLHISNPQPSGITHVDDNDRYGAVITSSLSNDIEASRNDTKHDDCAASSKSIGIFGSLSIAVNSLAGPAILQLPFQYQHSGLIPTTTCLIGVAVLSAFVCLHMANTVSKIPGNSNFDKPIEFSDPFRVFWNEKAYKVTQVLFFLTSICLNIAAIVDTAEVVDSAFGLHATAFAIRFDQGLAIKSWNVEKSTRMFRLHEDSSNNTIAHDVDGHYVSLPNDFPAHTCTRQEVKLGLCDPFHDTHEYGHLLLTLGYIITAAIFLPICLRDLKENTTWQLLGFGILVTLSTFFCFSFSAAIDITNILSFERVSLWGHTWGAMLGVIMFNFALVLAIPAWLHEKKSTVSVQNTVIQSTVISTILYIAVGITGALAIPHVNVNMLSPMVSGAYGTGMQFAGTFFAFFIIGLDIPLFCVLTRYNLTHSGLCSVTTANWIVVYIPWALSWVFYQGQSIGVLLSWGGVLLTSAAAFILPLYLSLRALKASQSTLGSIQVYCGLCSQRWTWKTQVNALKVLLFIACGSVCIAIIGQLAARDSIRKILESDEYLNSTETLVVTTVDVIHSEFQQSLSTLYTIHAEHLIPLPHHYKQIRDLMPLGQHYQVDNIHTLN